MAKKKFIPTLEQFRTDISAIFIDEDLDYEEARQRLIYHLDSSIKDNIKDLSYEEVLRKYKAHISLWNSRYKEKETRGFIDKAALSKRKNILDFINLRLYEIDWEAESATPIRDSYLFGEINIPNLKEQLDKFLVTIKPSSNG